MNLTERDKTTLTRTAIAIIVLVIAGIYYFSELQPFEYEGYEKFSDKLQRHDAELNEALVQTRYGILKYYDPVDKSLNGVQEILNIFKHEIDRYPNRKVSVELLDLENAIKTKSELVSNFKQVNPIFINAISQFSRILSQIIENQASDQLVESALSQDLNAQLDKDLHFQLLDKINNLFRGILIYINLRTEERREELLKLVDNIRHAPQVNEKFPKIDLALMYADKILELQPELSKIDQALFEVPIVPAITSLNDAFKVVYQLYRDRSAAYRIILYILVFSLLVVLRWAFSRLQDMVSALNIEIQRKIKAEKELEEINRQLEQRVADRTKELTVKNKDLNIALGDLKEAQDQLIMQEKMASVGMLTTGIAHEIKNPLNFVNNFSEISVSLVTELQEELSTVKEKIGESVASYIDEILGDLKINCSKIKEHGERADNIVKTMLMHSQEAGVQKEMIDVKTLMDENLQLAQDSFQQGKFELQIERNYDPAIEKILAAPQTLGRSFIYILDNALYAMFDKLQSKEAEYKAILNISILQDDQNVVIKIKDNGTGIPAKLIMKVFEPFFTTKPTGKGNTGLGMSICYDTIVKQHKGDLRVVSEEGVYTEFTIILPFNVRKTEL